MQRRRSPFRLCVSPLAVAAALLVAIVPVGVLADPNAPGPGGASFPVIAQGVSTLATDQVAWRVIKDTAQAPGEAEPLERALGFVLPTDDAVLITDEGTGVQQRLAAAEAAFIPEGAVQRHESLGAGPTPYFRLALVPPADADYTAGGELVLAGDAFDAPSGRRDLDLILGNLRSENTASLSDSGFPTVILAYAGSFTIGSEDGSGDETELQAGEAAVFAGAVQLRATGPNASIFVAGVVGPEISSAEAPAIAGDDGSDADDEAGAGEQMGQIDVWVYDCPPEVSYQDLTEPYPNGVCDVDYDATEASLVGDNLPDGQLTLDDLVSDEGDLSWFVPYGEYTLATDNSAQVIVLPADALGETTGNTAILWPLTVDAEHRGLVVGIFLLH